MSISQTRIDRSQWEATLKELARLADKFPSSQLYRQMAECYEHLDEHEEAKIILDMVRLFPPERAILNDGHP